MPSFLIRRGTYETVNKHINNSQLLCRTNINVRLPQQLAFLRPTASHVFLRQQPPKCATLSSKMSCSHLCLRHPKICPQPAEVQSHLFCKEVKLSSLLCTWNILLFIWKSLMRTRPSSPLPFPNVFVLFVFSCFCRSRCSEILDPASEHFAFPCCFLRP